MGEVRNVPSDLHRASRGSGVRTARLSKKDATNMQARSRSFAKSVGKAAAREVSSQGPLLIERFDSVWDALGYSAQEAANLDARAELMIQIERIIKQKGWTQAVAAKECGVSQPRINSLLRGNIDKFSLDALVNMAASLGQKVHLRLKAA